MSEKNVNCLSMCNGVKNKLTLVGFQPSLLTLLNRIFRRLLEMGGPGESRVNSHNIFKIVAL